MAVDSAANTTVVWESGSDPTRSIRSAYRPAGGPWEGSVPAISSNCFEPELAVTPAGAAVVLADCGTGTTSMRAAYRPAGGSWSSSVAIPGSGSGSDPRVDIDDAGNAVAVWQSGTEVQSAYRAAAGTWVDGGRVSPEGDVTLDPDLAISPTGRALAIWRHDLSTGTPVITVEAARRDGAAWDPPVELTPPVTSVGPVAVDPPQVTWNGTPSRYAVFANDVSANPPFLQSEWGAGDSESWGGDAIFQGTSDVSRSVEAPQVALDDQGRAVAVWRSVDGSGAFRTQASTTGFLNDNWITPVTLGDTEAGASLAPTVAVDPAGNSTVVWRDLASNVFAVSRPPGGAFGPDVPIATTGFGPPQVTMHTAGDAIVAWQSSVSSPLRIEVAVNDVTPPALSFDGPSSAQTGSPVAFGASASDVWSPPVALSWDFGDGTTSSGAAVSHTYASAGTRTVIVTATDAAGNTASRSREIAVSGPPPGGLGRVTLGVDVPKQSWKKIRKARAVKLLCTLDTIGTCEAEASVKSKVAKRLGLKVKGRAKTLRIGAGESRVAEAGGATTLRVKLNRAVRAAIAKADKSVPLSLTVTGSAPERTAATLKRKLKIRR